MNSVNFLTCMYWLQLQEKRDGFVLQSKRKKLIQLKIMNFSQHLSSSPSFLISHPSLFSPLMDSSSPLPIITAGHCRRCCRCRRRHYLQPESNHHPTPPIHSTVSQISFFFLFVFDLVTTFMNCMIQQTVNKPFLHPVHHHHLMFFNKPPIW
jgi:hypothetical protein